MKKLLFTAVVIAGTSALVLAGRGGGFGRQGLANGPGWMHSGPGGFGRQGFANGPGWRHPGFGGRGQFGPLCNLQDDETQPLMLGILDLTDEQKEVVTKLVDESRAKLHADIEAVLTEEQIEALEQLQSRDPWGRGGPGRGYPGIGPRGRFGGPEGIPPGLEILDLTEEQKAAIEAIREKARTDAAEAETREARREIMQATHEEIIALLTEEQIEALEQLQPGAPWGRGGPGRGRW